MTMDPGDIAKQMLLEEKKTEKIGMFALNQDQPRDGRSAKNEDAHRGKKRE